MRFYIKVDDPYVERFLGIYGNELFNKNIIVFEFIPEKKTFEVVGVLPATKANEIMLKLYGYRDLTDKIKKLYEKPVERIEVFRYDITELLVKDKRLKILIDKLIKGKK